MEAHALRVGLTTLGDVRREREAVRFVIEDLNKELEGERLALQLEGDGAPSGTLNFINIST